MDFCPRCGTKLPNSSITICPTCSFKLNNMTNDQVVSNKKTNIKHNSSQQSKSATPQATEVNPTPIEPSDISPTSTNPTPIIESSIKPTKIQPTVIEPTPINPSLIEPTPITSLKPNPKVFSSKNLVKQLVSSVLGFIIMAILFRINAQFNWFVAILFGVIGISGLFGIINEIMKLPLNLDFINTLNHQLPAGKQPIDPSKLNFYQKVSLRIRSLSGNTRTVPLVSLAVAALVATISLGSVALPTGALFNTTITGRWAHELHSIPNESTWVMNITMWQLDGSDTGTLYMNVADDGTFNIEYNSLPIVNGTWLQEGEDYSFLHHDPDQILASLYENYRIRENYLFIYGGQYNYFEKV